MVTVHQAWMTVKKLISMGDNTSTGHLAIALDNVDDKVSQKITALEQSNQELLRRVEALERLAGR